MASGTIGSVSGLNIFMNWSSTESSITVDLYLYNQYRINTSTQKKWSISIGGNLLEGTVYLGEKIKESTTLIGTHTVYNLDSNKNYEISGSLEINLNSYNGSAVGTLNVNGTATTEVHTIIPQYPTITSFNVCNLDGSEGLTKLKIEYTVDSDTDYAWISLDDGNTWQIMPAYNIVTGLNPNTSYRFKLRVRRTDSQLTSESNIVIKSTYDIAKISNVESFEHGNNANITITNPARYIRIKFSYENRGYANIK